MFFANLVKFRIYDGQLLMGALCIGVFICTFHDRLVRYDLKLLMK